MHGNNIKGGHDKVQCINEKYAIDPDFTPGSIYLYLDIEIPTVIFQSTARLSNSFRFSQSIILSRRFTSAYKTANHLSHNLQKEVSEQTKIIRQKNDELVRLNRKKTDYFINLAHETKTPLTLILNYLKKYIKKRGIDNNPESL